MTDRTVSSENVLKRLWRRFRHALGFTECQGEYYCHICGRVQR